MSDVISPQKDDNNKKTRYQLSRKGRWGLAASFAFPAIVVVGLLVLLLSIQNGAETAMANLVTLLPVGYAFGAGMVASVNPCGFFLLPSYISYHLGTEEDDFYQLSTGTRIYKALLLGGVATVGFVVIFAVTRRSTKSTAWGPTRNSV